MIEYDNVIEAWSNERPDPDLMEEWFMDLERHRYRETTQRLITSDPDHGLAREIDQAGNVRSD